MQCGCLPSQQVEDYFSSVVMDMLLLECDVSYYVLERDMLCFNASHYYNLLLFIVSYFTHVTKLFSAIIVNVKNKKTAHA
jgi:hypothetical protein